jgi:O-methyltransferase involved in polyketide biosynthesis
MDANGGCLPPRVRWIDVDLPDVVPVRRKLLPKPQASTETGGSYTLTASSVLDPEWRESLPADRPTLIIAEGLVFYLKPEAGAGMFRDLTEHFRAVGGEFTLDCIGSNVVWWQREYRLREFAAAAAFRDLFLLHFLFGFICSPFIDVCFCSALPPYRVLKRQQ